MSGKLIIESISADLLVSVSDFLQGAKVLKIATNKEYKEELLKLAGEDKKILGVHVTSRLPKKEIHFCTKDTVLVVKVTPKTKETISFDLNLKQFEKLKDKATEMVVSVEDLVKKIVLKNL